MPSNLSAKAVQTLSQLLSSRTEEYLCNVRVTPSAAVISAAKEALPRVLPRDGLGEDATVDTLCNTIAPALAAGQAGPRYYGFVVGGRTPIALAADNIVSSYDPHVMVHLPSDTISTYVESLALRYVLDLLSIPQECFAGRTVTTGATASNILGLACARQAVVARALGEDYDISEDGFPNVQVDVLCAGAHASVLKAAALTGIGRKRCFDLTRKEPEQLVGFDLDLLEQKLAEARNEGRGAIVCPSYGEVNTGSFTPDMPKIRNLCDTYGAWMHLDAAFGGFAALHEDFCEEVSQGLQMPDSLTLDGHKWLNVPYDCAVFYTKDVKTLEAVCGPGGKVPAYLASSAVLTSEYIPSPLNIGIENSRRFRALPLYASMLCYGLAGYRKIICNSISFARKVEAWLINHGHWYDVLTPSSTSSSQKGKYRICNIVLFAPSRTCGVTAFEGTDGGARIIKAINETGKMFLTGTSWNGRSAVRLAVSNYLTDDRDFSIATDVLSGIMLAGRQSARSFDMSSSCHRHDTEVARGDHSMRRTVTGQ